MNKNLLVRTATRVLVIVPRKVVTPSSLRSLSSFAADWSAKEKVEEARYVNKKDSECLKKKHDELEREAQLALKAKEEKEFKETILPVMNELKVLLADCDDTFSEASLEILAKWKLAAAQ
eukprot:CAMPEP_0194207278 /NCGR_PEP_ID=MMETSP0156-20130528/6062_1 /TAXON_ID=33649 /ORGANISM="Thalassionema nitzschioides, Strain L26-B" /LENGTH=119 /DNA_ID=CAMNT_0038933999 /DNA_START=58 /DNA_END=417 /DNA_ORIENTATION=+